MSWENVRHWEVWLDEDHEGLSFALVPRDMVNKEVTAGGPGAKLVASFEADSYEAAKELYEAIMRNAAALGILQDRAARLNEHDVHVERESVRRLSGDGRYEIEHDLKHNEYTLWRLPNDWQRFEVLSAPDVETLRAELRRLLELLEKYDA